MPTMSQLLLASLMESFPLPPPNDWSESEPTPHEWSSESLPYDQKGSILRPLSPPPLNGENVLLPDLGLEFTDESSRGSIHEPVGCEGPKARRPSDKYHL